MLVHIRSVQVHLSYQARPWNLGTKFTCDKRQRKWKLLHAEVILLCNEFHGWTLHTV